MVLNHMVEPTPFEVKLKNVFVVGMTFILNGLNYHYVGPMMESELYF